MIVEATTDDTARLAATIEAEALQRAGTITYTQARQRIRDRQAEPVPAPGYLPYKTPVELWQAFKAGAKFVLHYHGRLYPVTRMEPRGGVCYVQPPGMPVKVYPNGANCESAAEDAIWLEQVEVVQAAPAPQAGNHFPDAGNMVAPAAAAPVRALTADADEAALYRWLRDTTHPDNLRKLFNGCPLPGAAEIRAAAGITATPAKG